MSLHDKESSLFGEGQLGMYWQGKSRLEGFVRMVIALAGADGKLLRFNGQVDFRYAGEQRQPLYRAGSTFCTV
jgi:hypothetical protein